ncbi:hypothetical protein EV189_2746 [Motilibacter rhizosphaerae]|uniref:Uncharacterized protein n=1 Tax=Motilibacter rhizosphaerae TaxID=598652 RepID=A0A4Q7NPV3_9ACTN|nr:hypothetical protein [Motilibacter rhizosphaerae]RZS87321.1 hypothetical protein EV189_2746 [Motilibacter rhizosphaerae]
MSEPRLAEAFHRLDDELPVDPGAAPAHLVRRAQRRHVVRRATAGSTAVVVAAALTGTAAAEDWGPFAQGHGRTVVAGNEPDVVVTPVPAPCTDPDTYSTSGSGPAEVDLPAAASAQAEQLLTPPLLGWPAQKGPGAGSARGFRGTADASAYVGAASTDFTSADDAKGQHFELGEVVAKLAPGKADTVYASALRLLTCTSKDHQASVLGAGPGWVAVKEFTVVADDGNGQWQWVVLARDGDVVAESDLNVWGKTEAQYDAHLSPTWLAALGEAMVARLAGQTAPVVGAPTTTG